MTESEVDPRHSVELKDVVAGYGRRCVLDGVSLALPEGRLFGLVGENGAGKSSVLRLIVGQLAPWSGTVLVWGRRLGNEPVFERRRSGVSLLPQEEGLFQSLSVGENLTLAYRRAIELPFKPVLAPEGLFEQLLGSRWTTRAGLLSGGARRLLAIEMAAAAEPRLLLLDEPTAGLAEPLAVEVLAATRGWCRREGRAALVVEQRTAACVAAADCAFALDRGKIVPWDSSRQDVDENMRRPDADPPGGFPAGGGNP